MLTPTELRDGPPVLDMAPAGGSIEIRGLSFRYADSDPLFINNLSLRIDEGESVAIVGPLGIAR